jgi:small-conductance mechanosensitive channel/CRP-like cAMP-binding protein
MLFIPLMRITRPVKDGGAADAAAGPLKSGVGQLEDPYMPDTLAQTAPSLLAAGLNLLLLLWADDRRRPLARTTIRCVAFALLTAAMFHDGIVPTQPPYRLANADVRFIRGVLEVAWWLLAAATIIMVVRTYYSIGLRLREHRFMLDVTATLLYLGAALAIITDVLNIPLKGVLATSGALAIVLGLALQSTLSDLFSGLLINATAPYRVGDSISLDSATEGEVVEITWRATHLAKANRDLIVVPNSTIAKSRIVNASVPRGPHATTAQFQAPSRFRPSDVVHALQLAIETCVSIAEQPMPTIATKSVGWKATDYEVAFYVSHRWSQAEALNNFYDAAHRHLESFNALLAPTGQANDASFETLEYRLIEAISVFGLLPRDERNKLAAALVRRELTPGQVLLEAGQVSEAITIIAYGILAASAAHDDSGVDIMRFGPREYLGESGPIAGVPFNVTVTAKTYAIVYDLPGSEVARLLKEHSDVAHALAAKLAAREREGRALMQPAPTMPVTQRGLADWIAKCIRSLHHLRS